MSIESVVLSILFIICCPLLLPSVYFSITVFSSELALRIGWPKYWRLSFSISPSIEYSGLISFSIDWFDLSAVQRILKSLLQHHNLKASILCFESLPYGPALTSVHDYWIKHSFDYMDLCQQSDFFAF